MEKDLYGKTMRFSIDPASRGDEIAAHVRDYYEQRAAGELK